MRIFEFNYRYFWFLAAVICYSCDKLENNYQDNPSPIYSKPKYSELKTGIGYVANPITGDTIKPLLNTNGDTLITGVPIKLQGKVYNQSELGRKVVIAKPARVYETPQNRYPLPTKIAVTPLNTQSLVTLKVGESYYAQSDWL